MKVKAKAPTEEAIPQPPDLAAELGKAKFQLKFLAEELQSEQRRTVLLSTTIANMGIAMKTTRDTCEVMADHLTRSIAFYEAATQFQAGGPNSNDK